MTLKIDLLEENIFSLVINSDEANNCCDVQKTVCMKNRYFMYFVHLLARSELYLNSYQTYQKCGNFCVFVPDAIHAFIDYKS